jgi:hypothetical protein
MEPVDDEKKVKWDNKSEKSHGIIRIFISHDLRFHLQGNDVFDAVWINIDSMFGKHNIIRSHQIEN